MMNSLATLVTRRTAGRALAAGWSLAIGAVQAQPAPAASPPMRFRGTVEKADATALVLRQRSGETTTLVYADNFSVSEVLAIDPATIQSATFIGTAAVPGSGSRTMTLRYKDGEKTIASPTAFRS
jgi:hypothetical protein